MSCNSCGQHTTPATPSCNNCSTCKPCESNVKICHIVVETLEEARQYKNSYVIVRDEGNAVYHTDDNGNAVSVSSSVIYEPGHTPIANAYSNHIVMDTAGLVGYYYSPIGEVFKWDITAV